MSESSINDDTLFAVIPIILHFICSLFFFTFSIDVYECGEQFWSWALNENKSQNDIDENKSQSNLNAKLSLRSSNDRECNWVKTFFFLGFYRNITQFYCFWHIFNIVESWFVSWCEIRNHCYIRILIQL